MHQAKPNQHHQHYSHTTVLLVSSLNPKPGADPDFWKGRSKSKHPFTELLNGTPVQIFSDALTIEFN